VSWKLTQSLFGDAQACIKSDGVGSVSMKWLTSLIALQPGGRRLIRNSIHLEGEILQFPVTFDLEDDRITRLECADDRLQLRHRL